MNGTFLNNQRIRRSPLKNGDEMVIGKHTLIFQDEGEVPTQPVEVETVVSTPLMEKMDETFMWTWALRANSCSLQGPENNGGADETRTRDLLRDRQAF